MSIIRRFSLVSGALFIITASLFCSTVLADADAASSAPPQEEMLYLTASQLAEEENLMAVLWVQRSAEFRGLSYQAYNLATREVDKAVAQRREKEKNLLKTKEIITEPRNRLLPLAVVLDIDDTIASHAALEAYYIEHPEAKADYNAWEQWISRHNLLLPGAADFLKYADKSGVQVFYVTGRGPQDKKVTEEFLQKAGLPFPDESHLLMNDGSGGKMNHFAKLARRYDVICYLGDNVGDFPIGAVRNENAVIYKNDFADNNSGNPVTMNGAGQEKDILINTGKEAVHVPETELQSGKRKTAMRLDIQTMLKQDKNVTRNRIVDAHKNSFGTVFILLPNPMYGDWEYNLAQKYRKLPAEQRIALRKAALKSLPVTEGKR
ncbi:MAG: hypothetical protein IJG43_09955 [Acidaminococcaceae bacterium]|nr:hypothetical protein [Acidaminococcaceae bacterium]